jgi:hypothetical protein
MGISQRDLGPNPSSGYLIVLRGEALLRIRSQARASRSDEDGAWLRELREAAAFLDPFAYRGMARLPLGPSVSADPEKIGTFHELGIDVGTDRIARTRFWEFITDDTPLGYESLLATADQARELWRLLDDPSDWEIIHVSVESQRRSELTVGYDVGLWGGEFYSLISDCVVMPTWHPPHRDDFTEIAEKLRGLNEHILFQTPGDALAFKTYYTSKPWAETNGFEVVRIDAESGI